MKFELYLSFAGDTRLLFAAGVKFDVLLIPTKQKQPHVHLQPQLHAQAAVEGEAIDSETLPRMSSIMFSPFRK